VDSKLLIDAIVRQTTVLIAALSTASGIRAPLAHVADQVFLELAKEIESSGVGRKVVADMFGLALRTYQMKVQRVSENVSTRNRSLWEAIYQRILEAGSVSRPQVEERFKREASDDVAAVLHDLVTSGLVRADRRGADAVYEASPARAASAGGDVESLALVVWVCVYRKQAVTPSELVRTLGASSESIQAALGALLADGRVRWNVQGDALLADVFVVPVGATQGWEAAVFHHFSAVAAAIAAKVQRGPGSRADDRIGGATLAFDVCPGHPYEAEVYGLLQRVRADVNELWNRVSAHNRSQPIDDSVKVKVAFYFGQNIEQDVDVSSQAGGEDA
jgi:predicted acetyltransferase